MSVNELVIAAIKSLLITQSDLEVIQIGDGSDAGLIEAIEMHQPDILIIDEGSGIFDQTRLLRLLVAYPEQRMISFNHQNNQLHIYHQQVVVATQFSDLIGLLYEA